MSVIAIDCERVCLYQQFDDTYPILLTPHIGRSAYRAHIHRINRQWRRASLWYLLTLVAFLTFALGPILLGAAVNEHALTGVDEEVGIAMTLLGVLGVVASVVLVRVYSRRMLLQAVEVENERLRGHVPEMNFRVEHATMTLPVKHVQDGASAVQAGEEQQEQQQLESSNYRLLLEVGQPLADAILVSAAIAEATQLLSTQSSQYAQFTLDPTATLYHPHLCPHCLHDSPHSALALCSLPAIHPAVSPLLAAHFLSALPRSAHLQPPLESASGVDAVAIDISTRPSTNATPAAPRTAAVLPAAVMAQ